VSLTDKDKPFKFPHGFQALPVFCYMTRQNPIYNNTGIAVKWPAQSIQIGLSFANSSPKNTGEKMAASFKLIFFYARE